MYKKTLVTFILLLNLSVVNTYANEILTSTDLIKIAKKNITNISTEKLLSLLNTNPSIQIIDVRLRSEILKDGGFIKANNVSNISRDKL